MWGMQGTPGPRAGARVPSIGKPGSGARSQNPDASQPQGPRRRERYAGVGRAHALSHTCSHVLTRSHTRASSFPLGRVTTPFSLSHPAGPPPAPRLLTERTRSHAPEVNPPTTAARSAALRASSPRVWAAASGSLERRPQGFQGRGWAASGSHEHAVHRRRPWARPSRQPLRAEAPPTARACACADLLPPAAGTCSCSRMRRVCGTRTVLAARRPNRQEREEMEGNTEEAPLPYF